MPNPLIIVVGNEKGGAGKTTVSVHLIVHLLYLGAKVTSIDVDVRQRSLSRYLEHRQRTIDTGLFPIPTSIHHVVKVDKISTISDEIAQFELFLKEACTSSDVVVIDTPGSDSHLSRLAHFNADLLITPLNDSFIDLDVIAKIEAESYKIISPSFYSEMVWKSRIERAKKGRDPINWVVLRNRLSQLDSKNKQNILKVLKNISDRMGFTEANGFSERVIFRELFLRGLTLSDLEDQSSHIMNMSHVSARQELRDFLSSLPVDFVNLVPLQA
jgi:chromosome partitioning protein